MQTTTDTKSCNATIIIIIIANTLVVGEFMMMLALALAQIWVTSASVNTYMDDTNSKMQHLQTQISQNSKNQSQESSTVKQLQIELTATVQQQAILNQLVKDLQSQIAVLQAQVFNGTAIPNLMGDNLLFHFKGQSLQWRIGYSNSHTGTITNYSKWTNVHNGVDWYCRTSTSRDPNVVFNPSATQRVTFDSYLYWNANEVSFHPCMLFLQVIRIA